MTNASERPEPKTILCVPGNWRDSSDLLQSVLDRSGGFLYAANVLFNTKTREGVECIVREHDPRLAKAFSFAGRHWTTKEDIDRIGAHSIVVYLIGPGGSLDCARSMMDFGSSLLKAGGLAIKVETAGAAHSPTDWFKMSDAKSIEALFRTYVIVATGESVYSCGMHNLGHRDAVISSDLTHEAAYRLVTQYLLYVLCEEPILNEGETFSLAMDTQRFRLKGESCNAFAPKTPFHNPYGMWRLVPVAGRPTSQES